MTQSNKDGKTNESANAGTKPRASTGGNAGANTGANPGTAAGGTNAGAHPAVNPAAGAGVNPVANVGANPAAHAWANPVAHVGANPVAAKTAYAMPNMPPKESLTEDERMKRYYELMTQIQESDFVLVELNLYLDTHPDDQAAIAQFNQFAQKSMILKQQFQALFGPLYQFGNSFSPTPFAWKEPPWPWQV